jgi:hypothetical protein
MLRGAGKGNAAFIRARQQNAVIAAERGLLADLAIQRSPRQIDDEDHVVISVDDQLPAAGCLKAGAGRRDQRQAGQFSQHRALRIGFGADGRELHLHDISCKHLAPDREAIAIGQRVGGKTLESGHWNRPFHMAADRENGEASADSNRPRLTQSLWSMPD